jgi:hypothetical protein
MNRATEGRTFLLHGGLTSLDEYRRFAQLACRLKPRGRVQVNISGIAEKACYEIPEGGSPWHEYASYNPALCKFFPHPAIAPHLPAPAVAANRALLLAKATLLRELGLEAAFWGYEGAFLPESFFVEHPHLRGPRIDHPRRSCQEAFALCLDLEETREMTAWMMAELKRHVPELGTYAFRTNDAGGGLCWATAQYVGPNGPRHCQGLSAGERVRNLVETLRRGAREGGGEVEVHIDHSNFWREEAIISALLPEGVPYYDRDPAVCRIDTGLHAHYPILCLVDPVAVIRSSGKLQDPRARVVVLDFRSMYQRDVAPIEVVEKVLDIAEATWDAAPRGRRQQLEVLHDLCTRWAGAKQSEALLDAFCDLHEALALKEAAAWEFHCHYAGVSMRYLTRPLLIRPEVLDPNEAAYFLPHIFNPHRSEAADDYADFHGNHLDLGRADSLSLPAVQRAIGGARQAASTIERVAAAAPEGEWLRKVALSLRVWVSIMRACHNFYFAQVVRDRNREVLRGEPRLPAKVETWTGDPDLLAWHELLRDELDNAQELAALLEAGGREVVSRAKDAEHEDTFLLGPDLEDQLRRKARLMREHWQDASRYLATPHK